MTTGSEDLLIEPCRYEQQLCEWEDARADREDELEMRNFEISRLQSAAEPLLRQRERSAKIKSKIKKTYFEN